MVNPQANAYVVERKNLRKQLFERFIALGDMSRKKSRQLNIDVGAEVLADVVESHSSKGGKLDKDIAHLYHAKPRREFAGRLLNAMARFNAHATGGNEIERLWKAVGELIITGLDQKGHNIYVLAKTSSPLEFDGFLNFYKGRAEKRRIGAARGIEIIQKGTDALRGRTLEKAYADDVSQYQPAFDETHSEIVERETV